MFSCEFCLKILYFAPPYIPETCYNVLTMKPKVITLDPGAESQAQAQAQAPGPQTVASSAMPGPTVVDLGSPAVSFPAIYDATPGGLPSEAAALKLCAKGRAQVLSAKGWVVAPSLGPRKKL